MELIMKLNIFFTTAMIALVASSFQIKPVQASGSETGGGASGVSSESSEGDERANKRDELRKKMRSSKNENIEQVECNAKDNDCVKNTKVEDEVEKK
jgi:hypothetical protein